jgi:hypothetical protein
MGPTFTPVMPQWQTFPMNASTPSVSVTGEIKDEEKLGEYLNQQTVWSGVQNVIGAVGNGLAQYWQFSLAGKAMDHQLSAINTYYKTQETIAGDQRDVALKQLELQMSAVGAQQEMHHEQTQHEETMVRLQGSVAARLAMIEEGGKTDRARIISMSDAFNRRSYDFGTPLLS